MAVNPLGPVGVWAEADDLSPSLADTLEDLGYGAIWIGGSPPGDLEIAEGLLAATDRIVVATGIVNIWSDGAATVAASYHRLVDRYPGRFLLGIGTGHPEVTSDYRHPYAALVSYLDELDAAGVAPDERVLAALGPKVLDLGKDRSLGVHPYLVTPEHTRRAREQLGPGALIAPEQKVVVAEEEDATRGISRPAVEKPYLSLSNYRANLKRLGWSEADLDHGGSDELIDALVARGDADDAAARVHEHLDAGADHVAIRLLTPPGADSRTGYRALAATLFA